MTHLPTTEAESTQAALMEMQRDVADIQRRLDRLDGRYYGDEE